jgi:tetratricopeptide (TPR) repeat protein
VARGGVACAAIALVLAAGCARSPEARKARHLQRGDGYFTQQRYRDAVIEYRNVLRVDASSARATRQLAFAHFQLGEFSHAYRYLLRAHELDPEDVEVRVKLATVYLLGGRPAEARAQAEAILEKDPLHLDALVIVAGAAHTPAEVQAAIRRLEQAREAAGARARFLITLGTLHLRRQDAGAAERAFREAVAREPGSVEAHLALGDFLVMRRDPAGAERAFRAAAEIAPIGSPARVKLADFHLLLRKPDEARAILTEITERSPDFLPAWRRLAEMAFAERKWSESVKALDTVLRKSPEDLDARFLRGRVHLALRETSEAILEFQRVLRTEPRLAPARFQLGVAHIQAGNLQQAKTELREAVTISPGFTEAVLLLAELSVQTGAPQAAIEEIEKLLARQPRPGPAVYMALGAAYLAGREPVKATEAYRKFAELVKGDPRGPYLVGIGLAAQGKRAEARKEFEASLAIAPGFVEPLSQLVRVALADRQPDAALARVRKQITLVPRSARLQAVLGGVHQARNEIPQAEAAFARAIELDPRLLGPYLQLAQIYEVSGRHQEALAKVAAALEVNPRNVAALMLSGVIHQQRGDLARAREAYERLLAANPRFAPALNNLAWLLSEHGGDRERALQLAQMAREIAPEEGPIADTLGWVLYRRGVYQRALALLKESATRLPDNPQVQYHLGMAARKAGDLDLARKALAVAVAARGDFPGKDEARKTLAALR